MTGMLTTRQCLLVGTTLGASVFLTASPAQADCLANAAGTTVVCNTADPDGFQATVNGVTIQVEPATTVGTGAATPSPLLSAGTTSVLNNQATINSGATAISLGGGSTVNNAASSSGAIIGDVVFGGTTGTQVNTFNNLGGSASLTGDITSAGALTINNNGSGTVITGDVISGGPLAVNNAGGTIAGSINGSGGNDSVSITLGGTVSGVIALGAGDDAFTIGSGTTYTGNVDLDGGNNTLTNAGTLNGNVTAGSGNDIANNSGAINGNINLGDGNNTINNSGPITGNITTGAGNDTLANTAPGTVTGNVNLGTGTDAISNLAGLGAVTKSGAGTLTLSGNNSGYSNGGTVLSILSGGTVAVGDANDMFTGTIAFDNGTLQTTAGLTLTNAILLNAGGGTVNTGANTTLNGVISGAGGLTKTGTGNLTLGGSNTYTGGTTISAGTLTGTAVSLQGNIVDNATLVFDDAVGGTYAGNISGTGTVTKANTGTVTFTGNNTYSGATFINGGILVVGPTGIGDASAVTINLPGILQLNANETIGSLAGNGALNGAFTLTTGGNNGTTTYSGAANVAGITKVGTGTFNLTGTGTLSSGLGVNGGTLAIGGTYTAPTNTVASGATLNILTAGALTGNVAGASGSTTIINGLLTGNLANAGTASGTGTVVGAVVNSGTLSPGNGGPGIFHVTGSYSQTAAGTLAMDITPSNVAGTGYDRLAVTGTPGTAALAGTLAVTASTTSSVPYVAGNTYDLVTATGISGNFGTVRLNGSAGSTLSPFISFAPSITAITGGQAYRWTVVRTNYSTAIGSAGTPNQIATANGFQGLVTGASGDAAALVASVDLMTIEQAQQFFDEASPEPYGAYGRALLDQGELFTRQVHLQMHETPNYNPGASVWGRGYGMWGNGDNDDFRFGSDQDIWGFAVGVDYNWDNFFVGVAGGWSKDKVDYALGNSSGDNKSWQLGAYGGYRAGAFSADLQIAYINGSMDASRSVNVGGAIRTAEASSDGNSWKVIGTVGYDFDVAGMMLRPFIGIDWTNGSIDGFTESGAGAASLTVDKLNGDRTDLMLGVDLGASKTSAFSPYARLVWRHNLDNQDDGITAFFNGNSASAFTVSAVTPGDDQIDVDAGLNYAINPSFSVFAGYQGLFREDISSHGISAGLRYSFGGAPAAAAPPPPPPPPPPSPPPATQTCPDGSVILAAETCPAPPPPPPPPPAPERG